MRYRSANAGTNWHVFVLYTLGWTLRPKIAQRKMEEQLHSIRGVYGQRWRAWRNNWWPPSEGSKTYQKTTAKPASFENRPVCFAHSISPIYFLIFCVCDIAALMPILIGMYLFCMHCSWLIGWNIFLFDSCFTFTTYWRLWHSSAFWFFGHDVRKFTIAIFVFDMHFEFSIG